MGAGYVTRVRWHCGQERDRQSLRCLQLLAAGTQDGHLIPSLASCVLLLVFSWLLSTHRGGAALVGLWQLISDSEQMLDKQAACLCQKASWLLTLGGE